MNFSFLVALALATVAMASPTGDLNERGAPKCTGPCGKNNKQCENGLCAGAVSVCDCKGL